jgi:hypothetical protein
MGQKKVLFEQISLHLPHPPSMLHVSQYQGKGPLLTGGQLDEFD